MLQPLSPLYLWFFASLRRIPSPPFNTLVKFFLWNGLALAQGSTTLTLLNFGPDSNYLFCVCFGRGWLLQDVQQQPWHLSSRRQEHPSPSVAAKNISRPCSEADGLQVRTDAPSIILPYKSFWASQRPFIGNLYICNSANPFAFNTSFSNFLYIFSPMLLFNFSWMSLSLQPFLKFLFFLFFF